MSKRIYVGNLPWSVTKAILENLFSGFGEIEDALVVANKFTGRSRGFGFVTFIEESAASKAITEMHEKVVEGRNLVVKEAMPLGERKNEEERAPGERESEEKTPRHSHTGEKQKRRKKDGDF